MKDKDEMKSIGISPLKEMKQDILHLNKTLKDSEQFIRYTSDTKEKSRLLNSINKTIGLIQDRLDAYRFLLNILEGKLDKEIIEIEKYVDKIQGNSNFTPPRSTDLKKLEKIYQLLVNKFQDSDLKLLCSDLGIDWYKMDGQRVDNVQKILVQLLQQSRIAELEDLVILRLKRPEKT